MVYPIHDLATPSGGYVQGDSILLWSATGRTLALITPESTDVFVLREGVPISAAILKPELLWLDGLTGTIRSIYEADGGLEPSAPTAAPENEIISGAWAGRWGLVIRESASDRYTFVVSPEFEYAAEPLVLERPAWVGGANNRFAILTFRPPFRMLISSAKGTEPLDFLNETLEDIAPTLHRGHWVSTAPVWIGETRLLLTFADVSSDRRVFVNVGLEDRSVSSRLLDVPMAFIGSDHSTNRLVAYQEIAGGRIVVYRWQRGG